MSSAYTYHFCVTKCNSVFCVYKQNSKDDTATIYNEDGRFQYNISDVSTGNLESESGGFFFGNLEIHVVWHIMLECFEVTWYFL